MTVLNMNLGENSYPITVGSGLLERADKYLNLNRKVFIITDDGIPNKYAKTIANLCSSATIYTVEQGEGSKSIATLEKLLTKITEAQLGRGDCLVAVGGGVVGDLSGFAASILCFACCACQTTPPVQPCVAEGMETAMRNLFSDFPHPATQSASIITNRIFFIGLSFLYYIAAKLLLRLPNL